MKNLSKAAYATYNQLVYLQDNHFPFEGFTQSNQQLADFLDVSIRTVQRAVKELKSVGIITTTKGFNGYNAFNIDRVRFQIVLEGKHLKPEQQIQIIPLIQLFAMEVNAPESAYSPEFQEAFNQAGIHMLSNPLIVWHFKAWVELHKEVLDKIYDHPSIEATLIGLELLNKELN